MTWIFLGVMIVNVLTLLKIEDTIHRIYADMRKEIGRLRDG